MGIIFRKNSDRLLSASIPKYCGMLTVAALVGTISSFVDGCITGKFLGADAMAAFGTAMPFVLILIIVGSMVLSTGGSICASRDIGNGNISKAKAGFTACIILGLILGAVTTVICFAFSEQLIHLTGARGSLAKDAAIYMKGFATGAIPTVFLTIMMAYANVDGNEKHSLIAVAIMIVSDITLDMILGVRLRMGLLGMALATSVSYYLASFYFLWVFLSGKSIFSFCRGQLLREMKEQIKFGYPSALNTLLISMRCFFINRILLSIAGSDAVSAFSFQSNFNQFFLAIATGVSTSVSMLVGIFIGESDKSKIRSTTGFGTRYGVAASILLGIILFCLSPMLSRLLMTGTAEAVAYSTQALRLFSFSLPLSIVCIILISFYQTMGNRKLANTIAVMHGLVWPLLFAYVLPFFMGLSGVWLSTAAAELITLLCVFVISLFCKKGGKTHNAGLFMLDETDFPAQSHTFLPQKDSSFEDLNDISRAFSAFLAGHDTSEDTASGFVSAVTELSEYLSDTHTQNSVLDAQGYNAGESCALNIRISGKDTDDILKDKELGSDIVAVSHHYSAGISFINIKTPEGEK